MSQKFPLRGIVAEQDYQRLCDDNAKDKLGNQLKIGDKVAYATCSRWACPVSIGEVKEIILEYEPKWIIDVPSGRDPLTGQWINQQGHWEPDMSKINCEIKVKGHTGDRGVTRHCNYIVKVV